MEDLLGELFDSSTDTVAASEVEDAGLEPRGLEPRCSNTWNIPDVSTFNNRSKGCVAAEYENGGVESEVDARAPGGSDISEPVENQKCVTEKSAESADINAASANCGDRNHGDADAAASNEPDGKGCSDGGRSHDNIDAAEPGVEENHSTDGKECGNGEAPQSHDLDNNEVDVGLHASTPSIYYSDKGETQEKNISSDREVPRRMTMVNCLSVLSLFSLSSFSLLSLLSLSFKSPPEILF